MTTATGIISWQAQASAFGDSKIDMQIASTRLAAENNHRFPGQYYDAETGLHQNYFRDYEASIGRYVTSDPIGLDGGLNTYAYVNNNPLKWVDPTGEAALPGVLTGFGVDVATPEPTDAAWPKWVGWGVVIAGAAIYDFCTSDDADDREQQCEELSRVDTDTCNAITRRRGAAAGAACHASASQRYAACLRGQPLPPLNTWNN